MKISIVTAQDMKKIYDVLVIGGGINGLSAAYHLARLGSKKIGLLERFKIGHSKGSSHGPSRITRSAYSHADYVRLMQWCHAEEWPRLERDLKAQFIYRNPALFFGPQEKKFNAYTEAVVNAKAHVEKISPPKARKLFPQLRFDDAMGVLLDHTAGIVAADQVIAKLDSFLKKSGAAILEETEVVAIDPSTDPIVLETTRGFFHTERLIVTAGAWAPRLVPALKSRLKVARQTVAYLKLEGDKGDFQAGQFPCWIYLDDRPEHFFYGLPKFGAEGIKMARHFTNEKDEDPNDFPSIQPAEVEVIREFAGKLLATPLQQIVKTEHCLYTYTANEDFIIDLHPNDKRIAIGSACSGHGFKFGPMTGRVLAELVTKGKTTIPVFESIRKRFAL